jgi:hypothetical protein
MKVDLDSEATKDEMTSVQHRCCGGGAVSDVRLHLLRSVGQVEAKYV